MPHKSRKLLCLLMALLSVLSLCCPALADSVAHMPDVTAEMSDAAYWADLQDGTRDVILTQEEIQAFNQDTASIKATTVTDLRAVEETFDGLEQNENARAGAVSDAEYYLGWTYTGEGQEASQDYFDAMIENCIDPAATKDMPVRYGIAVNRTLLRVFPAPGSILDDPNDPDFDYQAISSIRVNEPMIIYTTSADGKYYMVRISSCSGWVPAEDVAVCADRQEWLSAWDLPSEKLLVVWGGKEYTDASNAAPETARRMLTTGTALELVTDLEPGQLVGNRSPYHNYVVYLPVRRSDGSYEKQMALIPETADVSVGYLPLTMENIAMVALNQLGDAYGWGGMLDVEDCSGLIRSVYLCFGLNIARNGNWQAEMNIEKIDMTNMSLEEKRLVMDGMPLGSALCFNGHEMMYLGKVDGKYYVVSTVSSIVSPYDGTVLRTRDVMINTLDVKRGSGVTWLGALNAVFMPCYAKLDGKSYDFPALQWYHDGVAYCLESGVLPALDIDGTFGIGRSASRIELAQALWTLADSPLPAPETTAPPEPTDPEQTAAPTATPSPEELADIAMDWAVDGGYIAPDGAAEDPVCLQEALDALAQLAGTEGEALPWAESEGIVSDLDGVLPGDTLAREELAMVLYRYSLLPEVQAADQEAAPEDLAA